MLPTLSLLFAALIAVLPFNAHTFCATTRWTRDGKTIIGGTQGNATNQLNLPAKIYIDSTDALYIADRMNHRVLKWEQGASAGVIVAGGIGPGVGPGELWQPTSVTVDKQGTMYITDNDMPGSRVTRWLKGSKVGETLINFSNIIADGVTLDPNDEDYLYLGDLFEHSIIKFNIKNITEKGTVVAGGNGLGPALNKLEQPFGVVIDNNRSVYIADTRNSRIVKWFEDAKTGILVAGGNGSGNQTDQLSYPESLFLNRETSHIYVADTKNSRIMRFSVDVVGAGVIIAGGSDQGNSAHQLSSPHGLAFDSKGNLYVSDRENNRIQMFLCSSGTKFTNSVYFIIFIISIIIFFA